MDIKKRIQELSLDQKAKLYFMGLVRQGKIDTLPEDPKAAYVSMMMDKEKSISGMEDDPRATFTDDEVEDYYLSADLPELATELGYLNENQPTSVTDKDLDNLSIFPINIGNDSTEKSKKFYEKLKINNLKFYFDSPVTLAKKMSLRGIPTSILLDKEGKEFARIIGSIDFEDKKFIKWLKSYN